MRLSTWQELDASCSEEEAFEKASKILRTLQYIKEQIQEKEQQAKE